jgi:hypothetical protein
MKTVQSALRLNALLDAGLPLYTSLSGRVVAFYLIIFANS